MHDLYAILGLSEDAQPDEIRKSYRSLALRWHPDKRPPEEREAAACSFKELVGAYDVLRDPVRRLEYDTALRCMTPMRCSNRSSTVTRKARSGRRSLSRLRKTFHQVHEGPPVQSKHCWGWTPPPPTTQTRHDGPNPQSLRVWFQRGSSCVGSENETQAAKWLADARIATLQSIANWAAQRPAARLDICGCSERSEVGSGLRQRDMLGLERCQKTLAFLTDCCHVPAERCHPRLRLGEDFPGVEIRVMIRLEVEGCFQAASGPELKDATALDTVAATMQSDPAKHLLLELQYTGGERAAQRRLSALRQAIAGLGIARHKISGRVQAGLVEEVSFLLYEELSPLPD